MFRSFVNTVTPFGSICFFWHVIKGFETSFSDQRISDVFVFDPAPIATVHDFDIVWVYFHEHEPDFARPLLLRFNYCGIFPLQSCRLSNGKCKIHYIQYQKHAGCLPTQICLGCTSQCFAACSPQYFVRKKISPNMDILSPPTLPGKWCCTPHVSDFCPSVHAIKI